MAGAEVGGAAAVAVCCWGGLKIDLRLAARDEGALLTGVDLQQQQLLLLHLLLVAVGQADLEKDKSQMCRAIVT